MFNKILIANRGEIACRIIGTCRRLGIGTVAVYSDADAGARHVRLADQAIHIGPAAASESYLRGDRIIAAAKESGAQAIHPGYGFLSEKPEFARAVEQAGLTLIGPSAQTMELMGSKAAAKAKMAPAGVPLIPGYHGEEQGDEHLAREAERVGFPLMLKAAAGGGGKGMRVVGSAEEFPEALAAARRESSSAFGDDRMILERYLARPRHIEAQIFADSHGHTVHLFERDCSSQRRHQKIIEEAPAPNLNPALRQKLLSSAVRAAEAVDYRGAGTVEFLVDGDAFYFLEMNTRLQVEHPVTEMITGQDLVEWQLRVAAGQALPLSQDQIQARGHAMEARLYAEDPDRGFVPSSGYIRKLSLPSGPQVRIDRGVDIADTVSVHYDPMIAKLIVHAENRQACRALLQEALAACLIAGPTSNLRFLQSLAAAPVFAAGDLDTGLLDRDLASILPSDAPPTEVLAAAAAYWLRSQESNEAADDPWSRRDGWRSSGRAPRALDLEFGEQRWAIEASGAHGDYQITLDAQPMALSLRHLNDSLHQLEIKGKSHRLHVHQRDAQALEICYQHRRWVLIRHTRLETDQQQAHTDGRIVAPMPGKILDLKSRQGDTVSEGQTLLIMEAMKMELAIKAPVAGHIEQLSVAVGDLVEADSLLLSITPQTDAEPDKA
ncbi:MAG: acetyl/propionyl/methylcrotonyl-CoA carboxylase subunit alpha [Wenzhouxiangella sp.]